MLNLGYAISIIVSAVTVTGHVYASETEGSLLWALITLLWVLNWALHRCALDQHDTIQQLQDENDRLTALHNGEA